MSSGFNTFSFNVKIGTAGRKKKPPKREQWRRVSWDMPLSFVVDVPGVVYTSRRSCVFSLLHVVVFTPYKRKNTSYPKERDSHKRLPFLYE